MKVLIAITGASGSVYAERLIGAIQDYCSRIYLVITDAGKQVIEYELKKRSDSFSLKKFISDPKSEKKIKLFSQDDLFSPVASGSSVPDSMVILPCSMGTMARVAHGISSNLLERSADVVLKEKRQLIICPRESPLSQIHLENMLKLSQVGAQIIPCMPAFYNHPKSVDDVIDFVVARVIESLGLPNDMIQRWNEKRL